MTSIRSAGHSGESIRFDLPMLATNERTFVKKTLLDSGQVDFKRELTLKWELIKTGVRVLQFTRNYSQNKREMYLGVLNRWKCEVRKVSVEKSITGQASDTRTVCRWRSIIVSFKS